jgi:flagellar biogenesis protein FliO
LEVFTANRLNKLVVYIYYVSLLGRNESRKETDKQVLLCSRDINLLINVEYAKFLVLTVTHEKIITLKTANILEKSV